MNIVIIHGQNHEGSTCMVARQLAEKVGGEIREFFLPRDFGEPCRGCFTCFQTELSKCPHYRALQPLEQAMLEAELLIFDSPVYVYHATGQMMSFLDHTKTITQIRFKVTEINSYGRALCTWTGTAKNLWVGRGRDSGYIWFALDYPSSCARASVSIDRVWYANGTTFKP